MDYRDIPGSFCTAISYLTRPSASFPIIVQSQITDGFMGQARSGYVPDPRADDRVYGGHAMVMVGYVSEDQIHHHFHTLPLNYVPGNGGYFIVKNSWGSQFGDGGYYYISQAYLQKYAYALYAVKDAKLVLTN